MNVKNVKKLRTRLRSRKNPVGFNMGEWLSHNGMSLYQRDNILDTVKNHPCGTVACLAGQATIIAFQENFQTDISCSRNIFIDVASAWLELNPRQAGYLFFGHWHRRMGPLADVKKSEAINVLTRLIEGRWPVDWPAD